MSTFQVDEEKIAREIRDAKSNTRFMKLYGHGGTFLDLGANIGEVSLMASKQFDLVVGIEAHPHTFSRAVERTKDVEKIRMINAAVAAESGGKFYISTPEHSTGATAREKPRLKKDEYYEIVSGIGINELLENYRPRVIKMDIEGSEYDVIKAANFPDCAEFISVEFHGTRGPVGTENFDAAKTRLAKQGFAMIHPSSIEYPIKTLYFVAVFERKQK
jgi:FkbM family methyltransferase